MPAYVDARPPGLNCIFRRGTTLTTTITWPADSLIGRTFTATLDGVSLSLIVLDDVMIITATVAQTTAVAAGATTLFVLTETTSDDQPIIVGKWTASDLPSAISNQTVELTTGAFNVTITGGQPFSPDLFPELVAADPTEVDLATTGGVTTLTLLDTIARSVRKTAGQYVLNANDASATQTLTQNTMFLVPVVLSAGMLDRIGIEVTTLQATAIVRLGVYSDNGAMPLNLIAEAATTADASTNGVKDLTISAAIPVTGLYWFGVVQQVAATGVVVRQAVRTTLAIGLGTNAPSGVGPFSARQLGSVTGALPATTTGLSNNPSSACRRVHYRYA